MKRRRAILVCAVLAAGAVFAGSAGAHHSFAMFDFSKEATLAGTVREFHWMNPHIHILLDAADDKGRIQAWDIEGQAPNTLRPQGWSREALAAGEKVSIVVHPLKTGGLGGSLVRAYRADGALVGAGPATPRPGRRVEGLDMTARMKALVMALALIAPVAARAQAQTTLADFNGVWRTVIPASKPAPGSTLRWTPGPGELPPFNAEYQARYEQIRKSREQGSEETEPAARCLPPGMPYFTLAEYGLEVVQSPTKIAFFSEWMDAYRRVYLDRAGPPADYDPSYFGYSVGHWEGDTLVVETTRLRGDTVLDRYGSPHSDRMTITERFRLAAPDLLEDRLTVRDPVAFTKPWEFVRTYRRAKPGEDELRENTCTEGLTDGRSGASGG